MKEIFEQIYRNNEWGPGSGQGALPIHNLSYVTFLQTFLRKNSIKSVVDFGCGDWQFSRYIDWRGINYYGCDLVESLIQTNRQNYARSNISFELLPDGTN